MQPNRTLIAFAAALCSCAWIVLAVSPTWA
jgi:hypothetical protein